MTDTMRDKLINAVLDRLLDMDDFTFRQMATALVDQIIIPLRDDIQASADQAIRATEKQAEIERSRGGFHD